LTFAAGNLAISGLRNDMGRSYGSSSIPEAAA
jgi:hypothetical protein